MTSNFLLVTQKARNQKPGITQPRKGSGWINKIHEG